MLFVLYERKLVYQWFDGRFPAFTELNINSIRFEIRAHFELIDFFRDNHSNGSERLENVSIGI